MKTMSEDAVTEIYNEMLDSCYEPVKVCGMEYQVSRALKELDPVAYRCGLLDYADNEGIEIE